MRSNVGEYGVFTLDDDWFEACVRAELISRQPSEDERAIYAAALGNRYQTDDWPACWDAIMKLAVAHHGRRTFVLQPEG